MPPRRIKRTDVVSLILYGVGALFFTAAAVNWHGLPRAVQINPEIYEVEQTPFSINALASSHHYRFERDIAYGKDDDLVFLYIMTPELCGVCLNEVTGYINILEEDGFAGRSVRNIILVLSKDLSEAERFTRISYLPATSGFGYDAEIAPVLERFKAGTMPRQLVMIDPLTDTLFFRHLLKTGEMTEEALKQAVLKEAREALANLK